MAQLYFYYGAMNCGKSSALLQVKHNYEERGMNVILCSPAIDTRSGTGIVKSRIGLQSNSCVFTEHTDFYIDLIGISKGRYSCVIIDEAQFLTENHVLQLARIADEHDIPVMCYGLRTDFQGKLFPGSKALMELADKLHEIKTICHCGKKASMVVRYVDGMPTRSGAQIQIGDQEYVSMCRKHYMQEVNRGYEV